MSLFFKKFNQTSTHIIPNLKVTPHRNYLCDTKNGLSNVQPLLIKDN